MWFLFFQICYSVFEGSECHQSFWVFPVNLRGMCLLLLLPEVFYKCKVDWHCSVQLCPYWFAASWLSITVRRMLKLRLYVWIHLCLLATLPVIVSGIWHCAIRCIHMRAAIFLEDWPRLDFVIPCLSLIIFLSLKFALPKVNTTFPAFFSLILTWYIFILSLLTYLYPYI